MARTVAIVEDDAAIRANYADMLKKHGYQVSTYGDRKSATVGFRTRLPDLALLDIGLGDEPDGGFTLCRELRALSAALPIIFLTARDSDFDMVSGLRMGADDYLTKEASLPQLLARISAPFRRADLLREPRRLGGSARARRAAARHEALHRDVERKDRGPHADGILARALARALSRPREGSRQPDARCPHRGRRRHHHLAREAHPAQVPGRRSTVRGHRRRLRHGIPVEQLA